MKALLPTIRFLDGSTVAYTAPRDTGDLRAALCGNHHPACDCREAMHAEDVAELRGERDRWKAFAEELIRRMPHSDLADLLVEQHSALRFYRQRYRDGLL